MRQLYRIRWGMEEASASGSVVLLCAEPALVTLRCLWFGSIDLGSSDRDTGRGGCLRQLFDIANTDATDTGLRPYTVVPSLVLLGIPVSLVEELAAVDLLEAAWTRDVDLYIASETGTAAGDLSALPPKHSRQTGLCGCIPLLSVPRLSLADRTLAIRLA